MMINDGYEEAPSIKPRLPNKSVGLSSKPALPSKPVVSNKPVVMASDEPERPSRPPPTSKPIASSKPVVASKPTAAAAPRRSIFTTAAAGGKDGLVSCFSCGRSFAPDRIEKHESVCAKTKSKKRKVFDVTKMRVQGTDAAGFVLQTGRNGNQTSSNKPKSISNPYQASAGEKISAPQVTIVFCGS